MHIADSRIRQTQISPTSSIYHPIIGLHVLSHHLSLTFTTRLTDLQHGKCRLKHGRHAITEVDVHELEDEGEGELGREESEEPLRREHVHFHTVLGEVVAEVRHVLLGGKREGGGGRGGG